VSTDSNERYADERPRVIGAADGCRPSYVDSAPARLPLADASALPRNLATGSCLVDASHSHRPRLVRQTGRRDERNAAQHNRYKWMQTPLNSSWIEGSTSRRSPRLIDRAVSSRRRSHGAAPPAAGAQFDSASAAPRVPPEMTVGTVGDRKRRASALDPERTI